MAPIAQRPPPRPRPLPVSPLPATGQHPLAQMLYSPKHQGKFIPQSRVFPKPKAPIPKATPKPTLPEELPPEPRPPTTRTDPITGEPLRHGLTLTSHSANNIQAGFFRPSRNAPRRGKVAYW